VTLVEVMVAVVLLAVGVLASVGTSAQVVRRLRAAQRRMDAVGLARSRLEGWRSSGCARLLPRDGVASGTVEAGELREGWWLRRSGAAIEGGDSVSYPSSGGRSVVVLRGVLPCVE
jgi:hypothetical protein